MQGIGGHGSYTGRCDQFNQASCPRANGPHSCTVLCSITKQTQCYSDAPGTRVTLLWPTFTALLSVHSWLHGARNMIYFINLAWWAASRGIHVVNCCTIYRLSPLCLQLHLLQLTVLDGGGYTYRCRWMVCQGNSINNRRPECLIVHYWQSLSAHFYNMSCALNAFIFSISLVLSLPLSLSICHSIWLPVFLICLS